MKFIRSFLLLVLLTSFCRPLLSMRAFKVILGATTVGALVTHACYHAVHAGDQVRYLNNFGALSEVVEEDDGNFFHSPTHHHVTQLYQRHFGSNQVTYKERIRALMGYYFSDVWSNRSTQLHEQLANVVVSASRAEEQHAATHYPVYHGTDRFFPILFATLMEQKNVEASNSLMRLRTHELMKSAELLEDPLAYVQQEWKESCAAATVINLAQRNPGIGACKVYIPKPYFNDPRFLAVNMALMANVGHMSRNSLRFVTPCPINDSPIRSFFPWVSDYTGGKPLALMQKEQMRQVFEEYGLSNEFNYYADELQRLCSLPVGVLLQIFVPHGAECRFVVCDVSNSPYSKQDTTEFLVQARTGDLFTGKEKEMPHLCIPLDQSLFGENETAVMMQTFVFGDPHVLEEGISRIHEIVEELVQKRGSCYNGLCTSTTMR